MTLFSLLQNENCDFSFQCRNNYSKLEFERRKTLLKVYFSNFFLGLHLFVDIEWSEIAAVVVASS
jgi:hypothetical protein